jgi:hypothetical protein
MCSALTLRLFVCFQREFQHRIDGTKLGANAEDIHELKRLVSLYGEHLLCLAMPNALVSALERHDGGIVEFLRPLHSLCFLDLSGAHLSDESLSALLELVRDRVHGLRRLHSIRLCKLQPNDDQSLFGPVAALLRSDRTLSALDLSENVLTGRLVGKSCRV